MPHPGNKRLFQLWKIKKELCNLHNTTVGTTWWNAP